MQIIEALDDAREEFVNSNYHSGLFEKTQGIIREWAEQNNIELGLTQAERQAAEALAWKEKYAWLEETEKKFVEVDEHGVPLWLKALSSK